MRDAILHTTKYDGSLHYRFAVRVVHESEELVVTYRPPGVVMESYRGTWVSKRHLMGFYWPDRHHNLCIMWNGGWEPRQHYVNIATPAEWDGQAVRCVDLDLDVIRPADNSAIIIDDEDEFERHIDTFDYPDELVDTCRGEVARVTRLLEERRGPFSSAIFDWRPGAVDEVYSALFAASI